MPGFTIVELLTVIVIVAILAAISIVVYNGVAEQAAEATLKSDLKNASTQLGLYHSEHSEYPSEEPAGSTNPPASLVASPGNDFQYSSTDSAYCLTATSTNTSAAAFNVSSTSGVAEGTCPGHTGGVAEAVEAKWPSLTARSCRPSPAPTVQLSALELLILETTAPTGYKK